MALWEFIIAFLSDLGTLLFFGDPEGDGIITRIGCILLILALVAGLTVLIILHHK